MAGMVGIGMGGMFMQEYAVKDLKLDMEIFIDSKPDFYNFQNDTKKLTEAEVAALFNLE